MRYGIVREIEGHPPKAHQRRLIERADCDILLDEGAPTRAALRAQRTLLFGLKPGDELLVCSVHTLQISTGELVQLLRKFDATGVTLTIVGDDDVFKVTVTAQGRRLLALLAANEEFWPARQQPAQRSRPIGRPLSRYQIDYALNLRKQGASLRTISQLFQTSPGELQRLMSRRGSEAENWAAE